MQCTYVGRYGKAVPQGRYKYLLRVTLVWFRAIPVPLPLTGVVPDGYTRSKSASIQTTRYLLKVLMYLHCPPRRVPTGALAFGVRTCCRHHPSTPCSRMYSKNHTSRINFPARPCLAPLQRSHAMIHNIKTAICFRHHTCSNAQTSFETPHATDSNPVTPNFSLVRAGIPLSMPIHNTLRPRL
jgi:hypothetical protein